MPVVHFQENQLLARGVLLERFAGEVVPGDQIELSPCPVVCKLFPHADLTPYRLRLVCQDEITDDLAGDFSGHKAVFVLHGGRPVTPADRLEHWSAPIDTVLRYRSAVSPTLYLDFWVCLQMSNASRHIGAYRDYSGEPKPDRPDMLGARLEATWWVAAVETEFGALPLPGG